MHLPSSYCYFDYAAGWPARPEALEAYAETARDFGNPGSVHRAGQAALARLDAARDKLAADLGVGPHDLIFTASATEANNLAVRGTVEAFRREHPDLLPKVLISAVEHDAVRVPAEQLAKDGLAELATIPVTAEAGFDLETLASSLDERVALVSIMQVSNELGCALPIYEAGRAVRSFRGEGTWPRLHVDAVQALAYVGDLAMEVGADLATYAGHKVGGVAGIGVLAVRGGRELLSPQLLGGGQERGLRAGTEDVPAAVAFAEAVSRARRAQPAEQERIRHLREVLLKELSERAPEVKENVVATRETAPHIVSLHVPHGHAQETLARLDLAGFAVAAGPACSARSLEPSRVVQAVGYDRKRAEQTVRVSFGPGTTIEDVRALAAALAG
jgi:cysteine desulfurase